MSTSFSTLFAEYWFLILFICQWKTRRYWCYKNFIRNLWWIKKDLVGFISLKLRDLDENPEYSRISVEISFARPGTQFMLNHTRCQSGAMLFSSKSGMLSNRFLKLESRLSKNVLLIFAHDLFIIFDWNLIILNNSEFNQWK